METAYLDHGAAAPLDARVAAAMLPWLGDRYGSPMGLHERARDAEEAVEAARVEVAALAGWDPDAVIFTAGATEARNLAVKGLLAARADRDPRVVASVLEHTSTLAACRTATRVAGELVLAEVDGEGRLNPAGLARAVAPGATLVCLVHGQAEVGAIQDVPPLATAARAAAPGVLVHLDAEETAGVIPIAGAAAACDTVALGGRAMGGPGWAGALLVRPGVAIHPLVEGGPEERGKRGGPHDLPGIVGLGAAAALARTEMADRAARVSALRDRLEAALAAVPEVRRNGPAEGRLPGHAPVSAARVDAEALVLALAARGVACSPGSACAFGTGKASPVLEAMGVESRWARSAVLFTLGPETTAREVDDAAAAFAAEVQRLRAISPIPG